MHLSLFLVVFFKTCNDSSSETGADIPAVHAPHIPQPEVLAAPAQVPAAGAENGLCACALYDYQAGNVLWSFCTCMSKDTDDVLCFLNQVISGNDYKKQYLLYIC